MGLGAPRLVHSKFLVGAIMLAEDTQGPVFTEHLLWAVWQGQGWLRSTETWVLVSPLTLPSYGILGELLHHSEPPISSSVKWG